MMEIQKLVHLLFISLFVPITVVGIDCQNKRIECYDCDSRRDESCANIDPSNQSGTPARSNSCNGCCVELFTNPPNGKESVVRTCTDQLVINYFMIGEDCMRDRTGESQMCFCDGNLCNRNGIDTVVSSAPTI